MGAHELNLPGPALRNLHLVTGVAAMLAFIFTGQYMHWVLDHLRETPDGPRLFYRTTHIYLMWAAALNMALGCFLVQPGKSSHRVIQLVSSIAVLLGPVLLLASFFLEPFRPDLERPMARYANLLAFGGVTGHLVAWFLSRADVPEEVRESV